MQYKKVFIMMLLLSGTGLTALHAQEAVVAAGGNNSGAGGSVSYSVGQVVYTTHVGGTNSIAQGVQQTYEISVVTEIRGFASIDLLISAYPNPTTDYLTLKIDASPSLSDLSMKYQLYNADGKCMLNGKISASKTEIAMRSYQPGIYFLNITDKNAIIKTFKIIKF